MFRALASIIVVIAVVVGAFFFSAQHPQPEQPDVCSELRQIELATDQVAKFNHRLRVRRPELQYDRDSGGVTLELVSVYSSIYDAQRKLGCR
jgi:hypothetical protein